MGLELVELANLEPFDHRGAREMKSISFKYSPDFMKSTDLLLENVVVGYKPEFDQERTYKKQNGDILKVTYL